MTMLERQYADVCDVEFTIERARLWMLQTRVGRRTARAAFRIASDLVDDGLVESDEALAQVTGDHLVPLIFPRFETDGEYHTVTRGIAASPNAAVGRVVVTTAEDATTAASGQRVILVRRETNPDDLPGMIAAEGILTSHGGKTSHAGLLRAVRRLHEQNPMLGLRGVRLGLTLSGLYRMQVRAIAVAPASRRIAGGDLRPHIMIPLVDAQELALARADARNVVAAVGHETGAALEVPVGTMVELPRAAFMAGPIAQFAEFFSYGTNDLTQTARGMSRDDAEESFFSNYLEKEVFRVSPLETIDELGVRRLAEIAATLSARLNWLRAGVLGANDGIVSVWPRWTSLPDCTRRKAFSTDLARSVAVQLSERRPAGFRRPARSHAAPGRSDRPRFRVHRAQRSP